MPGRFLVLLAVARAGPSRPGRSLYRRVGPAPIALGLVSLPARRSYATRSSRSIASGLSVAPV